ncbi:MAG: hypothetical protein WCJ30_10530, partial [Deltaproteobacteria bacterium]
MSNLTLIVATATTLIAAGAASGLAPKPPRRLAGTALAADTGPSCTAALSVQPPRVRSSCTIDERVTRAPGMLSYPCGGSGAATADFGPSRFQGTVQGGLVDLTLITQFDFTDRCHWQSLQR